MTEKCVVCDKNAVAFCDAMIGASWKDGCISLDGPHFTCDALLCEEHRSRTGFICGKQPDTIDRCPYHIENPDYGNYADGEQASASKRRQVFAELRRASIASVC